MVILATTRRGLESLRALIDSTRPAVWVGAGVLTPDEVVALRAAGLKLSVFAHDIASEDPEQLANALATVAEHHPDEVIWVDHKG